MILRLLRGGRGRATGDGGGATRAGGGGRGAAGRRRRAPVAGRAARDAAPPTAGEVVENWDEVCTSPPRAWRGEDADFSEEAVDAAVAATVRSRPGRTPTASRTPGRRPDALRALRTAVDEKIDGRAPPRPRGPPRLRPHPGRQRGGDPQGLGRVVERPAGRRLRHGAQRLDVADEMNTSARRSTTAAPAAHAPARRGLKHEVEARSRPPPRVAGRGPRHAAAISARRPSSSSTTTTATSAAPASPRPLIPPGPAATKHTHTPGRPPLVRRLRLLRRTTAPRAGGQAPPLLVQQICKLSFNIKTRVRSACSFSPERPIISFRIGSSPGGARSVDGPMGDVSHDVLVEGGSSSAMTRGAAGAGQAQALCEGPGALAGAASAPARRSSPRARPARTSSSSRARRLRGGGGRGGRGRGRPRLWRRRRRRRRRGLGGVSHVLGGVVAPEAVVAVRVPRARYEAAARRASTRGGARRWLEGHALFSHAEAGRARGSAVPSPAHADAGGQGAELLFLLDAGCSAASRSGRRRTATRRDALGGRRWRRRARRPARGAGPGGGTAGSRRRGLLRGAPRHRAGHAPRRHPKAGRRLRGTASSGRRRRSPSSRQQGVPRQDQARPRPDEGRALPRRAPPLKAAARRGFAQGAAAKVGTAERRRRRRRRRERREHPRREAYQGAQGTASASPRRRSPHAKRRRCAAAASPGARGGRGARRARRAMSFASVVAAARRRRGAPREAGGGDEASAPRRNRPADRGASERQQPEANDRAQPRGVAVPPEIGKARRERRKSASVLEGDTAAAAATATKRSAGPPSGRWQAERQGDGPEPRRASTAPRGSRRSHSRPPARRARAHHVPGDQLLPPPAPAPPTRRPSRGVPDAAAAAALGPTPRDDGISPPVRAHGRLSTSRLPRRGTATSPDFRAPARRALDAPTPDSTQLKGPSRDARRLTSLKLGSQSRGFSAQAT